MWYFNWQKWKQFSFMYKPCGNFESTINKTFKLWFKFLITEFSYYELYVIIIIVIIIIWS